MINNEQNESPTVEITSFQSPIMVIALCGKNVFSMSEFDVPKMKVKNSKRNMTTTLKLNISIALQNFSIKLFFYNCLIVIKCKIVIEKAKLNETLQNRTV